MRYLQVSAILSLALLSCGSGRADPGFNRWVQDFWPVAQAEGISRSTFEITFSGMAPDTEVLQKAANQAEFVKPMWDYVASAASEKRVATGRQMLVQHRALLDRIEAAYGVDRHVLVAIWGMESSYGEVLGNPKIVKSVIRSLATLGYADPKRGKFGRQQLIAALKILQSGDVSPAGLTGSWAGAMGHTQFIPTTYLAYAVDFDGDGRRSVWNEADALASAGHYLKKSGWVGGRTWGYEVALPPDFDYRLVDAEATHSLAAWERMGVRRASGQAFPRADDNAVLIAPAGAAGPAFLMLRNHFVIKRYNNATAYALGVGHLADRLRGGGPFVQAWPQAERPLSREESLELQSHLMRAGLYAGAIDGKIGPGSRAAIRAYQARLGWIADGFAGMRLLQTLRSS